MLRRKQRSNDLLAQKFEEVFRSNYRLLFSLGYQLSGDRALTKDVIQAFFLEVWEKQVLQKNIDNPSAYLRKSFYRKMMTELKAQRMLPLSLEVESKLLSTPSYEELLINFQQDAAQKARLQKALAQLPPQQKEMIRLRFHEGLSYEDIASNTGKSKQTVYNQIYTAIKKLKGTLLVVSLLVS